MTNTEKQITAAARKVLYRKTRTQLIQIMQRYCWDEVLDELKEPIQDQLNDRLLEKEIPRLRKEVLDSKAEGDELSYGFSSVASPKDFHPDYGNREKDLLRWATDYLNPDYDSTTTSHSSSGPGFHMSHPRWGIGENIYRGERQS